MQTRYQPNAVLPNAPMSEPIALRTPIRLPRLKLTDLFLRRLLRASAFRVRSALVQRQPPVALLYPLLLHGLSLVPVVGYAAFGEDVAAGTAGYEEGPAVVDGGDLGVVSRVGQLVRWGGVRCSWRGLSNTGSGLVS